MALSVLTTDSVQRTIDEAILNNIKANSGKPSLLPIIWDDSITSSSSLSPLPLKKGRFMKNSAVMNNPMIRLFLGMKSNNPFSDFTVGFFIDDEPTRRKFASTHSTSESMISEEFSVADLPDGIHTLTLMGSVENSGATGYLQFTEIYIAVGG